MKKRTLLKTMLLLCAIIVGNASAWADDATITFASQTSGTSDGSSAYTTSTFVSKGIASSDAAFGTITCSNTGNCYSGKKGYGLKAGGSSAKGLFTISFSTPLSNVTKITLNRASYNDSKTATITVKNGSTTLGSASTPSSSTAFADMEISNLEIASLNGLTVETSKYCYIKSITITYSQTAQPSFTASNVNIDYDATGGSIAYTVNNGVEGGSVSAAVTSGDWLTLGSGTTSPISFTCSANSSVAERTATVTLTYTYGENQTVTKNVTVTQAADPNAFHNISNITKKDTEYKVKGTVVATNARGFVIGDGTGYVYTYLNQAPTQSIGDKVTITGTTSTYGHILQFTSAATIEEATTSSYNNTPAISAVDATAIEGYNSDYQLSDYVQLDGSLAKSGSNYEITVGTGSSTATARISYPTSAQTTALSALVNKDVRVKGYFAGFSSSTFTVMMESVEEIVIPKLSVSPTTATEFTYEYSEDLCDEQVFTVTGTNLTAGITVSVTGDYDLRGPSGGYGNSSLILSSGDEFGVNLKDNIAEGEHNGTLTIASTGATSIVINLTGTVTPYTAPAITPAETTVNVVAAGNDETIGLTLNKIDETTLEVRFFDANGNEVTDYDWMDADISYDDKNDIYNIYYVIDANDGEARTAYLKVYGQDNNGNDVFSELVTITQAKYVPTGTLSNANIVAAGTADGGYANWTITDSKGKTWSAYAIKNQHSNATSSNHFLQIKKYASSTAYYIQVPDYGRKITSIKMTVSSSSKPMTDGGNSATLFFSASNQTSATGEGVAAGTGDTDGKTVTIDCSSLNLNTGYITASGAVRIWDVEVTYEPLELNSYGYATYASTNALDFTNTDGYTAWQITGVTGNAITFSKITGTVAAGTGVLLMGTADEVTIINAKSGTDISSTNKLVGITTATVITADQYYGLSGENFVKLTAGTVPAGKALLPASVVDNSSRLSLVFEEASGISQIEKGELNTEDSVYNLNGQRVVNPQKGLYIVNGRKVIVK